MAPFWKGNNTNLDVIHLLFTVMCSLQKVSFIIKFHLSFLGCNQPVQMLSLLVYVAAEVGAQQFIEIIFTSSTGRVVFNAYKDNLTLPEVIARDHGNEETANYLEDVTKR